MPNINQLTKLFQAIASNDQNRATNIAKEIIASEETIGHRGAAQLLRGALNPNGHGKTYDAQYLPPMVKNAGVLTGALQSLIPNLKFAEVMLLPQHRAELNLVIKEWKNRLLLKSAGITRRKKLLFFGPPGCGKSLTAAALGVELDIPTYIVRFDSIIGAYLGQTAIHLRELFRFAEETPCILLIDEVDALGKKRGNPLDVGELDRIVIALMQELEHSQGQGLIIATSNLPKHLDEALWRRFDLVVEFPKPTKDLLLKHAKACASRWNLKLTEELRKNIIILSSYSEAERLIEARVRDHILKDS